MPMTEIHSHLLDLIRALKEERLKVWSFRATIQGLSTLELRGEYERHLTDFRPIIDAAFRDIENALIDGSEILPALKRFLQQSEEP